MIRLGPGGSPEPSTLEGVKKLHELGLNALEVEFTHGIHMLPETAKEVGEAANKLDIALSIHAPYFINLNSAEKPKIYASKQRILKSCELGEIMGARYVVFHPGFYGKSTPKEAYEQMRIAIAEMQDSIKEEKWKVQLAPEATGKMSQFGTMDELLQLTKDTGCHFTVDFSHLYAKYQGKIKFADVFEMIRGFRHIHAHFSGIEFTDKGERKHLVMEEEFFMPLAEEIMKRKPDITIISESPIPWQDSLKMKKILERIGAL